MERKLCIFGVIRKVLEGPTAWYKVNVPTDLYDVTRGQKITILRPRWKSGPLQLQIGAVK